MKRDALTDELVVFHRALASRSRLRILSLLATKRLCVNALARSLEITQPAVSQHLEVLKTAGLVIGERSGTMVHYRLDWERLKHFGAFTALLLNETQSRPHARHKDGT